MNPLTEKEYSVTISELYDLQKYSIKMGLENISSLCHELNNPQESYPTIHVAGTNGKGSTSFIIQSILSAHGLKVGLYTSPHLVDFRERIRINSNLVEKEFLVNMWNQIRTLVYKLKATFFDTTTTMAFEYFKRQNIDIAVIETGLGGRLDSTNVLKPIAVVMTPIAIDHIKQLGRNHRSIAKEKAVIIKKGSTLFSATQNKTVKEVINEFSTRTERQYYLPDCLKVEKILPASTHNMFDCIDYIHEHQMQQLKISIGGSFQVFNACLAYMTARWYLDRIKISFSEKIFREVLAHIRWNGRLQRVSTNPDIYLDVSHNYSGFKETLEFIRSIGEINTRWLLIGLLDDKQYKPIVRLLQNQFSKIVITEPKHERALLSEVLNNEFKKYRNDVKIVKSVIDAHEYVVENMDKNDHLFVMGSHFIVGELLKLIYKKHLTR
jgi:dihydrofolate synthase/folylpolyglutamate synthase